MPCDSLEYLKAEERRREEERRQRELTAIMERIKAGDVRLVLDPVTGDVCMDVPQPIEGMGDSCVLAGLARMEDYDFIMQCQALGIRAADLIAAHGHSH